MAKPFTLPATDETLVFVNDYGFLSITQNPSNGDDTACVSLSREQARLIAAEIMRLDGVPDLWRVKGQA